jgi:hypothetical protein
MIFSKDKYIIAIVVSILLLQEVESYIDVDLTLATSSADVCLNMPLTINNHPYHLAISLYNQQEFIVSPNALTHSKKQKSSKSGSVKGVMHVSSL